MVFNHSVKVPATYRAVSKVIQKVQEQGAGLKASIYADDTTFNRNKQRVLALATKILEKSQKIEYILRTTQILVKEPLLNPWLARVLIHELVWRKELDYECKPIQTINSYKKEIHEALATYKEESDSLPPSIKVITPRYARINTYKLSVADVIEYLRNEGMILIPSQYETYSEYLDALRELPHNHFIVDFHIKEMLAFAPDFPFFRHELHKDSTFMMQDKSSCMAPLLLDPPKGAVVLDMCAAPGMKTNYLANLVGKNGRVYAVEYNQSRYLTLSKLIQKQGMKNVFCMHRDAIKVTGDELADVEYILVDPSCSGSGIVNRTEFQKSSPDRLVQLAKFQKNILRHALTKFPNVKRVAYSTCSIHPTENEEVVTDILNSVNNFQLVNLQEKLGSNWNNFGSDKYGTIGTSCLYTKAEEDLTNGFFVAVFQRIEKKKNRAEGNITNETTIKKEEDAEENIENDENSEKSKKKIKKRKKEEKKKNSVEGNISNETTIKKEEDAEENIENDENNENSKKKIKKRKKEKKKNSVEGNISNETTIKKEENAEKNGENDENNEKSKKNIKKRKKEETHENNTSIEKSKKMKKQKQ